MNSGRIMNHRAPFKTRSERRPPARRRSTAHLCSDFISAPRVLPSAPNPAPIFYPGSFDAHRNDNGKGSRVKNGRHRDFDLRACHFLAPKAAPYSVSDPLQPHIAFADQPVVVFRPRSIRPAQVFPALPRVFRGDDGKASPCGGSDRDCLHLLAARFGRFPGQAGFLQ